MSFEFDAEFWVTIAFLIFLGVLAKMGVHRMILDALDARSARIKAELDEARRVRDEAQALLAAYQRKRQDADREADAIIVAAQQEAERLAAEAKAKALADVRAAAADAAVGAAERILAETAKGKVGEGLVTQGIRDLKSNLN